jgi:transcriptional regulator with XRE-family HTH domain
MKTYAEKAIEAREMLGYSQKDLAELLGVSQAFISKVEKGEKTYSKPKEITLIKKTGLPPRYFDEDSVETIITDNKTIVLAMIPEIEAAGLTIDDVRAMLKPLARKKLIGRSSD